MNSDELLRLRRFRDSVFRTLDKYIIYLAKTEAERRILRDVKQELYDPELYRHDQKRTRKQ